MHSSTIYVALAAFACTLVDAHGKIAVAVSIPLRSTTTKTPDQFPPRDPV